MDDFDFDFGDFLGDISSGLDLSGGDTSWLDDFDWSGALENLDFSGLDLSNVIGDISAGGLGGLEDVVITGTRGLDPYEVDELTSRDETDALLSNIDPYEIDELTSRDQDTALLSSVDPYEIDEQTSRDQDTALLSSVDPYEIDEQTSRDETTALDSSVDPYEIDGGQGSRDEDDALTPTKEEPCPPGSETVQKFRDGSTMTLDCKGRVIGSTPKTKDIDDVDDDGEACPPGSETTTTYENGATITFDCKGRVISSTGPTTKPDTKCPPNSNTTETLPDGTKVVKDCKGNVISTTGPGKTTTTPTNDFAKWAALLGGILGLLGRPSGGGGGGGYKGGIPKYTATRGPARSPTEGGRRPGGAGIGSLTGGVSYTPVGAAGGGLMGLAGGGKPARYLRGGTDGMADKIQTSIDGKQPARLSHGEFVIPADVVSHLGNGNSDAGADVLYEMMDKVRKARTGTTKQGKQINPRKYTPA